MEQRVVLGAQKVCLTACLFHLCHLTDVVDTARNLLFHVDRIGGTVSEELVGARCDAQAERNFFPTHHGRAVLKRSKKRVCGLFHFHLDDALPKAVPNMDASNFTKRLGKFPEILLSSLFVQPAHANHVCIPSPATLLPLAPFVFVALRRYHSAALPQQLGVRHGMR
eukprot:CAMPEP_0179409892 /NCGR_PEP_ID=MMETSP0799-20121207/2969_1 /TAXON_ID=46947 /ORGANISM="Geminigera cryophila, Strain CCMP2564" /LENGTH=166 /DNA_ID=CAMNT_0021181651 /DNA_START=718 /DNA_END=1214 /DNA_ORIENTATION=-